MEFNRASTTVGIGRLFHIKRFGVFKWDTLLCRSTGIVSDQYTDVSPRHTHPEVSTEKFTYMYNVRFRAVSEVFKNLKTISTKFVLTTFLPHYISQFKIIIVFVNYFWQRSK